MSADERRKHTRIATTSVKVTFVNEGALSTQYVNELSHGGMFIETSEPAPVESPIEIILVHPVTRSELTLAGTVCRHVPNTDGTGFVGMDVLFADSDDCKERLHTFVTNVQTASTAAEMGGISGRIEELGIENLIQMLGLSSRRGRLTLTNDRERGTILFKDGRIVQAYILPSGVEDSSEARELALGCDKAFYRMLMWDSGAFEFKTLMGDINGDASWSLSLDQALLEGVRHKDELARLAPKFPRKGPKLYLDVTKAKEASPSLSPDEKAVAKLIKRPTAVGTLLDQSPLPDLTVLEVLARLADQHLITLR